MSKTHTAKALAFCATPRLIIIAYSHYLRKIRLNQRRLFGAACSSGTLAATRSSPSESCCWIVPAWRACAARAVSCAANNAVLHSANLAFNSLICTSFTASCACSVSTRWVIFNNQYVEELFQSEYSPDNVLYIFLFVIGGYNNNTIGFLHTFFVLAE